MFISILVSFCISLLIMEGVHYAANAEMRLDTFWCCTVLMTVLFQYPNYWIDLFIFLVVLIPLAMRYHTHIVNNDKWRGVRCLMMVDNPVTRALGAWLERFGAIPTFLTPRQIGIAMTESMHEMACKINLKWSWYTIGGAPRIRDSLYCTVYIYTTPNWTQISLIPNEMEKIYKYRSFVPSDATSYHVPVGISSSGQFPEEVNHILRKLYDSQQTSLSLVVLAGNVYDFVDETLRVPATASPYNVNYQFGRAFGRVSSVLTDEKTYGDVRVLVIKSMTHKNRVMEVNPFLTTTTEGKILVVNHTDCCIYETQNANLMNRLALPSHNDTNPESIQQWFDTIC